MSQAIDLAALSRFAARVLNARPELAAELAAPQPVTRAEMSVALAGAAARAPARRHHRGRLRIPRRHAPSALRQCRAARLRLRFSRVLLRHPGPRMGALRMDQGAGVDGRSA